MSTPRCVQVQFEIAHNAIHLWVGGDVTHSMGHLHFASYDPVFFLHHANVDRIFAIWQELQKYRSALNLPLLLLLLLLLLALYYLSLLSITSFLVALRISLQNLPFSNHYSLK